MSMEYFIILAQFLRFITWEFSFYFRYQRENSDFTFDIHIPIDGSSVEKTIWVINGTSVFQPYPDVAVAVLRFAVCGLRLRLRLRSKLVKTKNRKKNRKRAKTAKRKPQTILCGCVAVLFAVCGCGCGPTSKQPQNRKPQTVLPDPKLKLWTVKLDHNKWSPG